MVATWIFFQKKAKGPDGAEIDHKIIACEKRDAWTHPRVRFASTCCVFVVSIDISY